MKNWNDWVVMQNVFELFTHAYSSNIKMNIAFTKILALSVSFKNFVISGFAIRKKISFAIVLIFFFSH